MAEFFRFRSIDALLDKYHELEKQTIYFASPEELNDPMEGFRDIVWSGDRIVWTNLFKHYTFCLHRFYFRFKIVRNSIELNVDNLSILGHWDNATIPLEKSLFDDIWNRFCNLPNIQEIIGTLANTKRKIRYKEIVYYLRDIQTFVLLDEVQKSYIAHGFMSESEILQPYGELSVAESMKKLLDFMKRVEAVEDEQQLNSLFQVFEEQHDNVGLTVQYNTRKISTGILGNNALLELFDFPKLYVENLKNLPFPKWWTACFTESYDNLSVWAKYADGHKGACLIFEENLNWKFVKYRITPFHKVSYENKPTELDFFRSIGAGTVAEIMETWYTDETGKMSECAPPIGDEDEENTWRENYWDNFFHYITTKNKDWEYEQEHRVILYDIVRGVVEKEDHILTYDFNSLKGIIFGMRTSIEDKLKIIDIIKSKCDENNRINFKFFQADYSSENGDIRKYQIQLPFAKDTNT